MNNLTNLSDDLFKVICRYLTLEDKINLSDVLNKSCFHYYDFYGTNYTSSKILLQDLFDFLSEDEYIDGFCEFQSYISLKLKHSYDEYFDITLEDIMRDNYNNIANNRIQFLGEFILSNLFTLYTKTIIEYIENHNLPIIYDKSQILFDLEEKYDFNVFDTIVSIYKDAFSKDIIESFCHKCGNFGHDDETSSECIFYDVNS